MVILQSFNRKSQKYQEQIDVSLTSMKNMGLPVSLQGRIRQFQMSTQSNLDNQTELEQFLAMLSPSLHNEVTKQIF